MNRLSEYIKGMTATRQMLREARIQAEKNNDGLAMKYLISAFDSFVQATSCAVSIREGKKPKTGKHGCCGRHIRSQADRANHDSVYHKAVQS